MLENKWSRLLPKKNQWLVVLLIGILLLVIAMPTNKQTDTAWGAESVGAEESATDLEKRLEQLLGKMQNVGEVHVMMTFQEDYIVEGIVVIAEGGGKPVVVREITGVLQALFEVDSHKIKVIEKKK